MKKIVLGDRAVALGAIRAGVSVITACPDAPSSGILAAVAGEAAVPGSGAAGVYVECPVNGRAAFEIAAGAALSGARAMVVLGPSGLNLASDSLMRLNRRGFPGSLVVAALDGPPSPDAGYGSRSSVFYAESAVFDPSSVEEAYVMTAGAFDWSGQYGRPVLLRPGFRIRRSFATVDLDAVPGKPSAVPDASVNPGKKRGPLEEDLAEMRERFSSYRGNSCLPAPNALDSRGGETLRGRSGLLGIAAGGIGYSYVMEALNPLPPGVRILKVGAFPFPDDLALRFLEGISEVLVVEERDHLIEDGFFRLCGVRQLHTEILGKHSGYMPRSGEYSPAMVAEKAEAFLRKVWVSISDLEKMPGAGGSPESGTLAAVFPEVPPAVPSAAEAPVQPPPEMPPLPERVLLHCPDCPRRGSFRAVQEAVRKYGKGREPVYYGDMVCPKSGDTPPPGMEGGFLSQGAGITVAQGAGIIRKGITVAFTGDAAFFHSGISGLVNAVRNRQDILVVIFDTGKKPGTVDIPALSAALGVTKTVRLDTSRPEAAETAIGELIGITGVRLAVFEGPCSYLASPERQDGIKEASVDL